MRRLARQPRNADQARRLLALASIYDGGSRGDAARLGSVTVQIVRDWVVRFNDRGADGLINGKAPGKPSLLNDEQTALAKAIERGPTPYLDGVVRWRLCDQAQWIWEEFRSLAPSKSDRNEIAEPIANLPFAQKIQIRRTLGIPRVRFNDDWYYAKC